MALLFGLSAEWSGRGRAYFRRELGES